MYIQSDQQKKSILSKLFKNGGNKLNQTIQHPSSVTNNYTTNPSFNDQLMNQTNFGFNPARQTIVSPAAAGGNYVKNEQGLLVEPLNARERRELNT